MQRIFDLLASGLFRGGLSFAAPNVTAALNAASYAGADLPNGSIAQGSMFVLFGSSLGPLSLHESSGAPLQTELAGSPSRLSLED